MSLNDIRDQAAPVRLLRNILKNRRIPHGLLFYGPEGVGKQLAAMEMARAMNCTEEEADACGGCLQCRRISSGNHADVKVITPSGKGRIINVETIDMINELTAYQPFEGGWRVFIIEEAHRMGIPAQNHFLKTLEEPASKTLFILLTDTPRRLLDTIRSRCQQVRFGALRPETVTELILRDHDLDADAAAAVAAVSQGQMARALDLIESERRVVVLDAARRLQQGDDPMIVSGDFVQHLRARQEAIRAAAEEEAGDAGGDELSREDKEDQKEELRARMEALIRRELSEYLYLFKTWYRDVLVYQHTSDTGNVLNRDQQDLIEASRALDAPARIEAIEKAWRYIERNLSIDRVFRDLFFTLAP